MTQINFSCKYCEHECVIEVPFGSYLKINEGVCVEEVIERAYRDDMPVRDVVCPSCGCSSGLRKIKVIN